MAARGIFNTLILSIVTWAIIFLTVYTVSGQTVEQLQAQIDSIQAVQIDSGLVRTKADLDSIVSNRVKLVNAGISAVKHHADSMWVDVDFAVGTTTGYQKACLKMTYLWMKESYEGQDDNVLWRLRLRKDRAKEALKKLDEYF